MVTSPNAESALQGMAVVDTDEKYIFIDEAYRSTFGPPSGELIGSDWKSIIHPEDIAAAVRGHQEMQASGIGQFQGRTRSKFGFTLFRRFLLVKSFDREKAFSGHFCFVRRSQDPNRTKLGVREGEEVFHVALDEAPVGGVLVDPATGFRRTNETLCEMLGYTGAELSGKDFADIIDPEDFEDDATLAYLVLKGALSGFQMKKRFLQKNRDVLWVDLSFKIIRDEGGAPLYAIALILDLSDSKRAQQLSQVRGEHAGIRDACKTDETASADVRPRFSAEGLLEIITSLPDCIAISTATDGRYVLASDGFLRFCGRRREDVIGRTALELDIFAQPRGREELAATKNPVRRMQDLEFNIRTSAGEERIGLLKVESIDLDGRECLLTVIDDVSEQRRLENLLRASEERYHAVAEDGWEGILLVDASNKKILEVTRSFLQLLGYSRSEILKSTLYELIGLGREKIDQDVAQVFANQINSLGERPFWRKDGSMAEAETYANVAYYKGAPVLRVIVHDLKERRRFEEQVRHAVKMEALGRFAGGIAHDFNNLLVGVLGKSTLLQRELKQNTSEFKLASEITSAALRARELTAQLVSFSRSQVQPVEILDLNDVVRKVEGLLRRIISEDIRLICEPDSPIAKIRINRGQLERVILNLAANASDAMPGGGTLSIRTANVQVHDALAARCPGLAIGDYALLSIKDTGCGMDSVTQSHIFEPFFTTKGAGAGTGLGLSIVYGIISQAGGHVAVDSHPSNGTTFDVYLPQVREQGLLFQPPTLESPQLSSSLTVLVVEDEKTVRSLVEEILRTEGFHVLSAEDAGQALIMAREHAGPIHLLVSDVIMPDMRGTQLAREVQRQRTETKVLFMSGYSDRLIGDRSELRKSGLFLPKPFTPEELCQKVREALNTDLDNQDI